MSNILELADGTKIDKDSGEVIRDTQETPDLEDVDETVDLSEETDETEISEIKSRLPVNRHTGDLPGDINSTKAIALISALSLFGISDREIAYICGTEIQNVVNIKKSERYSDFLSGMIDNVLRGQSDSIRALFINNSRSAASNIVSGLRSKSPDVRYAASKEVLDRGGFRPADVVEHRIRHENELKIIHISGDAEKSVTIEASYDG